MAKTNSTYVCSNCNHTSSRKILSCPSCNELGTFVENSVSATAVTTAAKAGLKSAEAVRPVKKASTISQLNSKPIQRVPTGIHELDRVLGGGFVEASVTLFAGEPGAGKSTLCLDMANRFALMGKSVLYSSGEESEQQIGLRAKRMRVTSDNIKIVSETNLETLLGHVEEEKPEFMVVDSLQVLASSEISGSVGSLSQSKEAANTLTRLAKSQGITMVLINQINKSGEFAGNESIQHIVDAAIIFESSSDTPLKFLRATKNRFGDITEVGVFQHAENGLEEVSDPGGIFLETDSDDELSGTSCSFISEGVRQIPVEIQALVTETNFSNARKQFNGVNQLRGQIVCAILDKFCGAKLHENDVFASTVAGVRVNDPMADLSLAASILSSIKNKPFPGKTAFVGELGLTGQVRGSFMVEHKIREAARLGFDKIVIPAAAHKNLKVKHSGIKVESISSVKELLKYFK
jgi:DNA repair protein RadA/Sms